MALLTIGEAAKRTGVSKETVRNYVKDGKIRASRRERHGQLEYAIDENELDKLPKPYKKRGDTGTMAAIQAERAVPQGTNFTPRLVEPPVEVEVLRFKGSQAQAVEFYRTLQLAR